MLCVQAVETVMQAVTGVVRGATPIEFQRRAAAAGRVAGRDTTLRGIGPLLPFPFPLILPSLLAARRVPLKGSKTQRRR